MSRTLPWFQMHAAQWDRHTKYLTPEQRGYLIQLWCESWECDPPGTLPADPEMLWRFAGAPNRKRFDKIGQTVLDMFELHEDRYICRELAEQYQTLAEKHAAHRRSAQAGGRALWAKRKDADSNAFGMPTASQEHAYQIRTDEEENRTEIKDQRMMENSKDADRGRSNAFPGTEEWFAEQKRKAAISDMYRFRRSRS